MKFLSREASGLSTNGICHRHTGVIRSTWPISPVAFLHKRRGVRFEIGLWENEV